MSKTISRIKNYHASQSSNLLRTAYKLNSEIAYFKTLARSNHWPKRYYNYNLSLIITYILFIILFPVLKMHEITCLEFEGTPNISQTCIFI